jgi:hypothetical protein
MTSARPSKAPPLTLAPVGAGPAGGALSAEEGAHVLAGSGVEYRVSLGEGGRLAVDGRLEGGQWLPLLEGAGMLYRDADGALWGAAETAAQLALTTCETEPGAADVRFNLAEELAGRALHRAVDVRLLGGVLEVRVQAPGGPVGEAFCGLHLGEIPAERRVAIPGLPMPLALPAEGFACAYLDRFLGRAGFYPEQTALYRPDTEGRTQDLDETFYVTLSADPLAPLPGLRRQAAPYRIAVENRVVVDLWSDAPYAEDEQLIRTLQAYGLEDVLLLYRNWQQYGYDRRAPALYPANSERGTNDDFRRLLAAAAESGWLVALREEYGVAARDSLYWNEKALAVWGDGRPRAAQRPGHDGIAAHRMLDFARLEATKIQRNYRPSAVFVDGHTAFSPEAGFRQVDDTAGSPSGTEAQAERHLAALTTFLRDIHEGPALGAAGEGGARFDTFAAGLVEGVVRGPDGGRFAPLVLDYELNVVRPKLLGLGAGSYRQFHGRGEGGAVEASQVEWDAYRATEIALGHGGYLGNYRLKAGRRGLAFPGGSRANAAREYFLLRSLQELYAGGPVKSVLYADGEDLIPLAQALRAGLDLAQARVRVEYGSSLTLWVNRSEQGPWVVSEGDERFELPPFGFAAIAPRLKLRAYSALVEGRLTDYCSGSLYTFVDTRGGGLRAVEGLTTDGAAALLRSSVPGRQDVVLIGARRLVLPDGEYQLSEPADVRLRHRSVREVEIVVMDSESGKPIHVQWPAFSAAWQGEKLRVTELADGAWVPARAQLTATRQGPQLNRARPGGVYRVATT